jgi:hypothetical protein
MDLGKLQRFAQSVAQAKLDVLRSPDSDLIDLQNATCSFEGDAKLIRSEIRGHEANITTLICALIRRCICGIGVKQDGVRAAEGTLQLPLDEPTIDLSTKTSFDGSPLLLLRFSSWLRQAPKVQRLVVKGTQLTEQGVEILRSAIEEGLLPSLRFIHSHDQTESLSVLAEQVRSGSAPRASKPAEDGISSNEQPRGPPSTQANDNMRLPANQRATHIIAGGESRAVGKRSHQYDALLVRNVSTPPTHRGAERVNNKRVVKEGIQRNNAATEVQRITRGKLARRHAAGGGNAAVGQQATVPSAARLPAPDRPRQVASLLSPLQINQDAVQHVAAESIRARGESLLEEPPVVFSAMLRRPPVLRACGPAATAGVEVSTQSPTITLPEPVAALTDHLRSVLFSADQVEEREECHDAHLAA